jgi:hypothetical protein
MAASEIAATGIIAQLAETRTSGCSPKRTTSGEARR